MDLEEANRLVSNTVGNAIGVSELHERLAAHHAGEPQKAAMAARAVSAIQEGIALLAALGHHYHVAEGKAESLLTFPQMLYKRDHEPKTVENQDELSEARSDGWRETPELVEPK